MHNDLQTILISRDQIAERIRTLGADISRDLDALAPTGEILIVPVMIGSFMFVADLVRELPQKLRVAVVTVSSYPGRSTESKGAQVLGGLPEDIEGRHVLLVDDILDSGNTLTLLRTEIMRRHPASVRACVLLRKRRDAAMNTPCEYIGFDIPDEFVVGYGLDYDDYYRNLPLIATLSPDAR